MRAVFLEEKGRIAIREAEFDEAVGPDDVKVAIKSVGVCGSDVHYYTKGRIGPFMVSEPMVLGHEASGLIMETGERVRHVRAGDRVCMEPGIPDWKSEASRRGRYNLDPAVAFWATPPIHGCLRERVVHPAALTYRLPESVSYEEGAFVEPLAIGVHAAEAASIKPGDVAVVLGCGTIGVVTALAALAGGCSTVIITDVMAEKLSVVDCYRNIITVDTSVVNVGSVVSEVAGPRGADIVFDASGNRCAITDGIGVLGLAGRLVLIGMPSEPVPIDVVTLQMKEITVKTIFRYANDFEKAIRMIVSKTVDVFPLISRRFPFAQSIEAFELAKKQEPDVVKILINTD